MPNRLLRLYRSLFSSGLRGAFVAADILTVVNGWSLMPETLRLIDEWVRQPIARAVEWVLAIVWIDVTVPPWAPTAYLSCLMTVITIAAILEFSPRLRPLSAAVDAYAPASFRRVAHVAVYVLAPLTILLLVLLALGDRRRLVTILLGLALSLASGLVLLTAASIILDVLVG